MNGNMADFADDHLVKQAKQGDVDAFTELVRRFQEKIYHTILSLTRNQQDAYDLAQETFMHAYKSLRNFKQSSTFYTWIYRIAVNLTLNFLKRRKRDEKREVHVEDYSLDVKSAASTLSPERCSMKKELSRKLKEAIDSLPLIYRASFVLVVSQGLTHTQVAKVLRCSENTVSWRMHKARKMLQQKLRPYLEGE
ncbi:MAG: sigma-70 family RNA polymerase sigma factor [Candidatus Aminicenantes bacterium]|nr:MAG: sigma-70 family RNA polymerase sigma factor [Candidatus Aminicenantes bacterium]